MSDKDTRPLGKQGPWYEANPRKLRGDLEDWLANAFGGTDESGKSDKPKLPFPGARIIIAPHAGYYYSGAAAAWAYKAFDLSQAKRVFILGPSHMYGLNGCAVTGFKKYDTPWGSLRVDEDVINALRDAESLPHIRRREEMLEHSLEMHLPYLWLRLEQTFGEDPAAFPSVVPIIVGNGTKSEERVVGRWLAPYLADPENAFIVSSDFCHWGSDFQYRPYINDEEEFDVSTSSYATSLANSEPFLDTIKMVDDQAIDAIKTGEYARFYDNLSETGNTVCGRHPIGVVMAGLEQLGEKSGQTARFQFVRYERSTDKDKDKKPLKFSGSSVSYVSAYAIV